MNGVTHSHVLHNQETDCIDSCRGTMPGSARKLNPSAVKAKIAGQSDGAASAAVNSTPNRRTAPTTPATRRRQRLSKNVLETKLALNYGHTRVATPSAAGRASAADATPSQVKSKTPASSSMKAKLEAKVNLRDKFAALKSAGKVTKPRKLNPGSVKKSLQRKIEAKVAEREAVKMGKSPVHRGTPVLAFSATPATKHRDPKAAGTRTPRHASEQSLVQKYGASNVSAAFNMFDMATAEETLRAEQRAALEKCHIEAKTRAALELKRLRHKLRRLAKAREIPTATGFSTGDMQSVNAEQSAAANSDASTTAIDRHGAPVPALLGSDVARSMLPPDLLEHFESKVQQKQEALFKKIKSEYEARKRTEFAQGLQRSPSNFLNV